MNKRRRHSNRDSRTRPLNPLVGGAALLGLCLCMGAAAPDGGVGDLLTYRCSGRYVRGTEEAPPDVWTHTTGAPYSSHWWGTTDRPTLGGHSTKNPRPASAEVILAGKERQAETVRAMHEDGVKKVMPYICSFTIGGDHEKRFGWWAFYDAWDEFSALGIGPRPSTDPIEWMQRQHNGELKYFYRHDHPPYDPVFRYAVCVNNPHWRNYLCTLTRHIAEVGCDGVFVDNNLVECYCEHCQGLFREYLASTFSAAQRARFFGDEDVSKLSLAQKGGGPLWTETQRFWSLSVRELLADIKDAGDAVRPGFMVAPNAQKESLAPSLGRDINAYAGVAALPMLEVHKKLTGVFHEPMTGVLSRTTLKSNVLDYKFALGLEPQSRVLFLSYHKHRSSEQAELCAAESLAFGGLSADTGKGGDALVAQREFVAAHRDLFENADTCASVALVAFSNEHYAGNGSHQAEVARLTHLLFDHHVVFDIIADSGFGIEALREYDVLLLPGVTCMTDEEAQAVREWVGDGGSLIASGAVATRYRCGAPRDESAFADILPEAPEGEGIAGAAFGAGEVVYRATPFRDADDRPAFVDALNRAAGRNLSAIVGDAPGIGVNVCSVPSGKLVVHLVNYDVRFGTGEGATLTPANDVRVAVPCPDGQDVVGVRLYEVPEGEQSLPFTRCRGGVEFTVPRVRVYAIAEVDLGAPQEPAAPSTLAEVLGPRMPVKPGVPDFIVEAGEGGLLVPVLDEELTEVPTGEAWLRHAHYVCVLAKAGEQIEADILCVRAHSNPDPLRYWVLGPDCGELARGTVAVGETESVSVTARVDGTHVIVADARPNAGQVDVRNQHCSLPATRETPLQVFRHAPRRYFYVPKGVEAFSMFVAASSPDETAKVTILSPEGEVVVEREGEFDRREELEVQVPAGQDGSIWSFLVGKAQVGAVDDVMLHLSEDVPGFVADHPARLLVPEEALE